MAESTWLSDDPSNWPSQDYPRIHTNEMPETKLPSPTIVSAVVFELAPDENYLERFSSLTRIKRIFGWCLRFKKRCMQTPETRLKGPLSSNELNNAFVMFVCMTEKRYLGTEHVQIKAGYPYTTELHRLGCIDSNNLGGRLLLF